MDQQHVGRNTIACTQLGGMGDGKYGFFVTNRSRGNHTCCKFAERKTLLSSLGIYHGHIRLGCRYKSFGFPTGDDIFSKQFNSNLLWPNIRILPNNCAFKRLRANIETVIFMESVTYSSLVETPKCVELASNPADAGFPGAHTRH